MRKKCLYHFQTNKGKTEKIFIYSRHGWILFAVSLWKYTNIDEKTQYGKTDTRRNTNNAGDGNRRTRPTGHAARGVGSVAMIPKSRENPVLMTEKKGLLRLLSLLSPLHQELYPAIGEDCIYAKKYSVFVPKQRGKFIFRTKCSTVSKPMGCFCKAGEADSARRSICQSVKRRKSKIPQWKNATAFRGRVVFHDME